MSQGVDFALEIVQAMLHHANSVQTQRYIGLTASRHKRDALIKGKPMYGEQGNVVSLVKASL